MQWLRGWCEDRAARLQPDGYGRLVGSGRRQKMVMVDDHTRSDRTNERETSGTPDRADQNVLDFTTRMRKKSPPRQRNDPEDPNGSEPGPSAA